VTRVGQSLCNLLSNACKFTEGGTVRLEVSREEGGGRFVFRVADTGIGMTPDHLGKLFKPFSQVDPSATRRFGGTGLGLAITSHFCGAMGGEITVESRPGIGSAFTIRLPRAVGAPVEEAREPRGEKSEPRPAPPFDPARPRGDVVLVVEDDETARDALRTFLMHKGFQ